MKAEWKIVWIVLIVSVLLGTGVYVLKLTNKNNTVISPVSSTFSLFSVFGPRKKPSYTVYGFFPYWSIDSAKYLQYDTLTDLAYFGLYIEEDGNIQKYAVGEDGTKIFEPGYEKWLNDETVTKVIEKAKKQGVRVALTIMSHTDTVSDNFLDCRGCWDNFLTNIKQELDRHKITDLNMNFEYSEFTEQEKAVKYAELITFLNTELDKTYGDSKVVVSVFADSSIKPRITSELNTLGRNSDGIFIMAYDFSRPTSDKAGPVAPVDGSAAHSEYDINSMLKDFLTQIAPNKLILGVPYYGYNWVVENEEKYAIRKEGSDEIGYSVSQIYDKIMEDVTDLNINVMWDEVSQEPYYTYISPETRSSRQVFFENAQSLGVKYKLAKNFGLAGVGIWALGYDGNRPELWNLLREEFVR
jgi:chitinase